MSSTMDTDIVKHIINGCTIKAEPSKEWESIKNSDDFSSNNTLIIDRLSKSLTTLLSYKVSPEAYQRYSVRLHIIDTLRDWCHIKGDLGNLKIFQDSEHSYNFLIKLLKKHMTEETLSNCDNPDDLIQVAEILLNAKKNDEKFMEYFVRVVNRMITLNPSDKSENFLKYIISESENIKLDFSFIEKIYCNQKKAFIEKPLADCFFTYCSDQSKLEELNKLDPLLEKITNSATLFQIVSMQMKEFFLSTEYSKVSVDFIQNILKKIQLNCDKKNKNIFSLYPSNLQHCVILLRINPSDHSEKSRNHTVNSLKDIFLKDWSGTLILISHFPDWLIYYLKFFEVLDEMSQKSVEIISIDDDDDADKCM